MGGCLLSPCLMSSEHESFIIVSSENAVGYGRIFESGPSNSFLYVIFLGALSSRDVS